MNNPRLLTGLLAATLWGGMSAHAQSGKVYTLEEIFETAEANSSMLRPSLSAETVEQCDLASAKAARLPDLSASLSLGFNGNGFTTARDFSDYRKAPIPHLNNVAGVSVTQPVYAGGAINGAIELAERKSTAARLATELSRDNIRLRLTGFYLDLYKYSNMRRVVNENITNARQVLEDMRHRYQQGMILLNDITRYELLLSDMDLQLIRIDNMMSILNNNLASTAGLPEGTVIQPDTALLNRSLSILSEAEWQSNASTNSPALKLAGQSVAINRTAEKLIKADFMPKVGLRAEWSLNGPILTEVPPINRNISYWFIGVGVSYNLSSLWHANRKLSSGRARTAQALDQLEAERTQLQMDVRSDYIKYMEAYHELKTRDKGVELAVRNYNTISTRYNEGMALITDQVDAANARLEAEQNLVNARINIIYSYYKLLFTTGEI